MENSISQKTWKLGTFLKVIYGIYPIMNGIYGTTPGFWILSIQAIFSRF